MDHYLLYICNGLSDNEKEIFINHIKILMPIDDCLLSGSAYYVPSLLIGGSTFFNIINFNSKLELNGEWKEIKDDLIANEINSVQNYEQNDMCDSSLIADFINNLANRLSICGSFTLDVILSSNIVEKISVSDNLEFASCLHRLAKWHGAHIIFLPDENVDRSKFEQWLEITNGGILEKGTQLNTGILVWRGSIDFKHPNIATQSYEHFELRVEFKENEKNPDNSKSSDNSCYRRSDHLVLHPVLQAMDVCNFSSIPQHIISPMAFKICVSLNCLNNDCTKPLQFLNSENGAALILRLGYSVLSEKPKPDSSLSTSKWLKMASLGHVKFPDSSLPDVDNYLTLAVTKSSNSENILAFILKEPSSLNTQLYFNVLNSTYKMSQKFSLKEMETDNVDISIPFLPQYSFCTFLQKVEDHNIKQNSDHECELLTTKDWNFLVQDFLSSDSLTINSTLKLNSSMVTVSCEEIDPTDWVERIYLLRKQIQMEEEKKKFRNVFMPLSPQKSQYNVSLTADDIKKYFLSSGEAKDNKKREPLQPLHGKINYSRDDLENLLKLQWPELLNCTYDDIYYNVNKQVEEKESIGNEMVRCFVPYETASTCNKQQSFPDAPISLQAKNLTPRKRLKSSVTEKSFIHDMMKPNSKLNKNILNAAKLQSNAVISTIMKTLHITKSMKSTNNVQNSSSQKKINPPVRCSPRKKPSINYYPSTSRNSSTRKSSQNPNELPELLKKKLRVAVASSLETNGISMENVLFRSCFKKLFRICQTFVQDMPRKKGSTSQYMQKIAEEHVKQVIKFEKDKEADL